MERERCAGHCRGRSVPCRAVAVGVRCTGDGETRRRRERVVLGEKARPESSVLRDLFPPGFDALAVAREHGVTLRLAKEGEVLGRVPAHYDPATRMVTINPRIDREKVAAEIKKRCWVNVPPEHAHVWLLLHEIGHHERRAHIPRRNGLLQPLSVWEMIEHDEEEKAVDQVAEKLYYGWKWGRGERAWQRTR